MKLTNKRIVITGGTSGIGFELVKQLCDDNEVIVISRSDNWQEPLPACNTPVALIKADLSNRMQLESAADELVRRYDHIDVLINNAAIQYTPELLSEEFDYDGIQHEIDLNFTSICQLTYLTLPLLNKSPESRIVNVNSGLALSPKRTSAIYCATKGALNIFSQSLGYQLADTNITVQQVFLPLVETKMTAGRGSGKLSPDHVATRMIDGISSGRANIDIGKAKLLRIITHVAPWLARRIMKNS